MQLLTVRGCRGDLCGMRAASLLCQTVCTAQLSPAVKLVVPLGKHLGKGKIPDQREEDDVTKDWTTEETPRFEEKEKEGMVVEILWAPEQLSIAICAMNWAEILQELTLKWRIHAGAEERNITYWPSSPHPSCVTVGVCGGVGSEGAKLSLGDWGGKLFWVVCLYFSLPWSILTGDNLNLN